MSEPAKPAADGAAPAAAPAKPKSSLNVLGLILPAVLSGVAAFAGVKVAAKGLVAPAHASAEETHHGSAIPPPGPTVPLEPFLVTVLDSHKRPHPMKVSLAIEFDASLAKEKEEKDKDPLKAFIPRIRDATLTYLRGLTLEEAVNAQQSDKFRSELLEKFRGAGAQGATRVLVTDLVIQ